MMCLEFAYYLYTEDPSQFMVTADHGQVDSWTLFRGFQSNSVNWRLAQLEIYLNTYDYLTIRAHVVNGMIMISF